MIVMYIIYLATGFLAGVVGGLLGTGGCTLMMPVIRFGFHFDPAVAVVFTATSGAIQHYRMKNVDKETAILVGYSGVLGVIIGSLIFGYVKPYREVIDLIIGIAFIVVSLRMLYEGLFVKGHESHHVNIPGQPHTKNIPGSLIGTITGIIGLGGGYALVPAFINFSQGADEAGHRHLLGRFRLDGAGGHRL